LSLAKTLMLSSMLGMFGSVVQAADLAPTTVSPSSPAGFVVTLGLGPSVTSAFPGSKSVVVLPTGHIGYRHAGEADPFYSPDDGFDIDVFNYGAFKAGPVVRYTSRRGLSNGNGAFFGLHNVSGTVEAGGFAEYWLWRDHLRTRVELRQGIGGHNGLVGNVEIDAVQRFGAFTAAIGPRMALGSDRYARAYFSVSPIEALVNGRVTPYQANGGVTSIGGFASLRYDIAPSWNVTVFGGYDRFVNSVAQSPIPNRIGTLNSFNAGAILAYSFNFKGFGVFGY
jgi:outer membrane protein